MIAEAQKQFVCHGWNLSPPENDKNPKIQTESTTENKTSCYIGLSRERLQAIFGKVLSHVHLWLNISLTICTEKLSFQIILLPPLPLSKEGRVLTS